MSRTDGLRPEGYRLLISESLPSAVDADTIEPEPQTLFTPPAHRNALDPDVTIVRGARGVGKTVWYRALQEQKLRVLAAETYRINRLLKVQPFAGYGTQLRPDLYPGPSGLVDLLRRRISPDDIWTAVLLVALGSRELAEIRGWRQRIEWVQDNPDERDRLLAQADETASRDGVIKLMLFDALDRLHPDRIQTDLLIAGIMRLSLELRTRTRNLRAKVFIRPDMYGSTLLQFPDGSKLAGNAADLSWSSTSLFGLFYHYLGNSDSSRSAVFRKDTGVWTSSSGRYSPPDALVGDRTSQQDVFESIAGKYMGTDHRKGRPYTWLPNHLQDGVGQVSPRSFLRALTEAQDISSTRFAGHEHALHWEGIRQGVQAASRIRVGEVEEDLPWVVTVIDPLKGMQVPVEQEAVVERWRLDDLAARLESETADPDERSKEAEVRTGPRDVGNYPGLIEQLIALGVMSRRADGRLDLPDVYRIAFAIGRKGGVPMIRN
jgi:hypothetical protein